MNQFIRIKKIGKGTYGDVLLVQRKSDLQLYALKRVDIMDLQTQVDPWNEVKILKSLSHENIIKYYDTFQHNDQLCILMEYADDCDLAMKIKEQKVQGGYFPEQQIISWFTQLCLALNYLHSKNILHRDIKTQNVFLSKKGIIKLGDFSISRVLDNDQMMAQTSVALRYVKARNTIIRLIFGCQAVYCMKYALSDDLFKGNPCMQFFHLAPAQIVIQRILTEKPEEIPNCYSPFIKNLVERMLEKQPDQRPSIKNILDLPELQGEVNNHSRFKSQIHKNTISSFEQNFKKILRTPQAKERKKFSQYTTFSLPATVSDTHRESNFKQKLALTNQIFDPNAPTPLNRTILFEDFLQNKLGLDKYQQMKNLLKSTSDPLKFLDEQRPLIAETIGENNLECIKIFKILVSSQVTPTNSHFRTRSGQSFMRESTNSQIQFVQPQMSARNENECLFHSREYQPEYIFKQLQSIEKKF